MGASSSKQLLEDARAAKSRHAVGAMPKAEFVLNASGKRALGEIQKQLGSLPEIQKQLGSLPGIALDVRELRRGNEEMSSALNDLKEGQQITHKLLTKVDDQLVLVHHLTEASSAQLAATRQVRQCMHVCVCACICVCMHACMHVCHPHSWHGAYGPAKRLTHCHWVQYGLGSQLLLRRMVEAVEVLTLMRS
jgi:hypothetical protein